MVKNKEVIIITGPTAIGKTKLAISLAKEINGEIINADSVSVYKYFNIGSAKPTIEEQKNIKHHLIDYAHPLDDFDVKKFQKIVNGLIKDIYQKNKIPIIVGGSTFYIQALIDNYQLPNVVRDEDFIAKCKNLSTHELYLQLEKIDPLSLEKIEKNNRRRIVRALEISNSGVLKSQIGKKKWKYIPFLILIKPRNLEEHQEKILMRIEVMKEQGLVAEVKDLFAQFPNSKPINSIGYKEIIDHLKNPQQYPLEKSFIKLFENTKRLAKQQLTWMNNKMKGEWFYDDESKKIIKIIKNKFPN